MKKQYLIVLATVVAMIVGLGSLALAQSGVVTQVPGNTVVQDPEGDLQLRNCDPSHPGISCSLPPGAPLALPGYFDIKTAKITEIGRGLVDLFVAVYEPIPAEPPYPFVNYFWQFEGGCVVRGPGSKDSVGIVWHGDTRTWSANWSVITSCNPRTIEIGDPVPFEFTEDGAKVRVALDDLPMVAGEDETLVWFAGIRRVPFIYPTSPGGSVYYNSTGVDYAPNVIKFLPPPIYITYPEDPALWDSR